MALAQLLEAADRTGSTDPRIEPCERDVEGMADRDPQALPVERIVALGAQQDAVHAERRGVPEEQSDVVDVADVLAAKQRDRPRRIRERPIDPRPPVLGPSAKSEQAPVQIESDDRLEHLVVGNVDRWRPIGRRVA
ncbi:MAG: hypothetical protein RJA16_606 [Planctomycetota bacterium]